MDFKNANELLALCEEKNLPISEIMRIREIELGETASEIVNKKMTRVLGIMKDAAFSPIRQPVKSMGGLIGGEARKLSLHAQEKKGLCGNLLQKAITYAMATLETNASMGLIVASPTAGSAGIVPGLMLGQCRNIINSLMKRLYGHYLTQVPLVIWQCEMQLLQVR